MLATLFGLMGNCLTGICLSAFSLLLFRLFLPNPGRNRSSWFQRMLRFTYNIYAGILKWLRPYVIQLTALDLLAPVPRTISTIGLSIGLGWGTLSLVGLPAPTWFLILLALHGAFVGWVWDGIVRSDDFQLGTRLE